MTVAESAEYLGLTDEVLPAGWCFAHLGDDLVEDVQPGFACGINTREVSGVPHLRPMNVSREGLIDLSDLKFVPAAEVDRDQRWLSRGDVLFNNTNSAELVGKTALYDDPEPRAFSNHMTRVRCRAAVLDPCFCAKVLHYLWQTGYFESVCSHHVSQASVGRAALLDTTIPLPPLPEQRRIVAKIEELLAHVSAARERLARVPAILKHFRQSVLAAACSGRLTEEWRSAQGLCNNEDALAPGWMVSRFSDLTDNHDGRRIPVKESDRAKRRGAYPYYGASGPIDTIDDYLFDGRFLLISEDGANLLARATPIAFLVEGRFWVNNHAHVVTAKPEAGLDYLALFLNQVDLQPIVTGSAQPKLTQRALNEVEVSLPPLAEQGEIVRRVEVLFSLASAIEQSVAAATTRANHLTQSILAKAFRGELVPTNAELAHSEFPAGES